MAGAREQSGRGQMKEKMRQGEEARTTGADSGEKILIINQ